MTSTFRNLGLIALAGIPLSIISCGEKKEASTEETPKGGTEVDSATSPDSERANLQKFYTSTRQLYNNRKYDELETLAAKINAGKDRMPNGDWKIYHFHKAMDCRDEEPEGMWQLHQQYHEEWVKKYPESVNARVAQVQFLINYAWFARSDKFASEVTEKGWQLFKDRLADARTILDQSRSLKPTCPMVLYCYQTIALGQGWERAEYDALFKEAKTAEPTFFRHDMARSKFLLPRWHGAEGEWEAVAEKQIALQGELGMEFYARLVADMNTYYGNVFQGSEANWRKVKQGFEDIRTRYPDSKEMLNTYCRMACLAGDQEQAKKLFTEIGADKVASAWKKNEFDAAKKWAEGK